ncbi:hypothetical protein, partial [Pseudomonas sp. CM25]|uniref:hypothetical protein n=1 Tax=Pseudomonas sp. CM25 TaxID=2738448 RepID=UPI001C49B68E
IAMTGGYTGAGSRSSDHGSQVFNKRANAFRAALRGVKNVVSSIFLKGATGLPVQGRRSIGVVRRGCLLEKLQQLACGARQAVM